MVMEKVHNMKPRHSRRPVPDSMVRCNAVIDAAGLDAEGSMVPDSTPELAGSKVLAAGNRPESICSRLALACGIPLRSKQVSHGRTGLHLQNQ